jgi:hypothetical protein
VTTLQLPDQPSSNTTTSGSTAQLILSISSGRSTFLADGKDFARLVAFYVGSNGQGAPSEIQVWMRWDHGVLEPQPLTIPKGEKSGEAHLTSLSPLTANISVVAVVPQIAVSPPSSFSVTFGASIYGFTPIYPSKMNIVDAQTIAAELFDQDGKPTQTFTKRTVTFLPKDSILHVQPTTVDILPGASEAMASLSPASIGVSQVLISTPDYPNQTVSVRVTGWLALILCLVAGGIGGFAAFGALKGSLFWRVFSGVLGGFILCWAYVFAALPKIDAGIAHNLISVPVIALIGGYLGIQAIDYVAKLLGTK